MEDSVVPLKLVEAIEILNRYSNVMADIRVAKFWGRNFIEMKSPAHGELLSRKNRIIAACKALSYTVEDKDGKLRISW